MSLFRHVHCIPGTWISPHGCFCCGMCFLDGVCMYVCMYVCVCCMYMYASFVRRSFRLLSSSTNISNFNFPNQDRGM